MKSLKTISLLLIFVVISIVAIIFIFYNFFSNNIKSSTENRLNTVNSLKADSLNSFIENIEYSMSAISQSDITSQIFNSECSKGKKNNCDFILNKSNKFIFDKDIIESIYFLNKNGDIFYSLNYSDKDNLKFKEIISEFFNKNSLKDDGVFLPVKINRSDIYNQIYISDLFEKDGNPYMFTLLVVFNDKGSVIGSIVGKISVSYFDTIFSNFNNTKNTEEVYVIGSDFIMRTNSRLSKENTRLSQIVNTENARSCFSGDDNISGSFANYLGYSVLGVHKYISKLDWCIISEVSQKEVMQVRSLLIKIFIILGLISVGTLLLFFEKIIINTNYLKKKQDELKRALFEKEKFKKALDTSEDNVFILDSKGRIIYMNASVAKYTGFSSSESIGKKIDKLWWSKINRKIYDDILKKIFIENNPGTWEIVSVKKNNENYHSEIFVTPVLKDGKLSFALVIEHDIEKRKKLESLKDEFIGIASHELRTPMTIIRGYASLLLDNVLGPLTDKQAETLKKIDGNSEKLIKLVTDMLDLSKLNKGGNENIKLEELDLKDFVEDLSKEFIVLADKKKIKYKTSFETDTKIKSNAVLLKRVFTNVIGNAIKFTDEGGNISVKVLSSKKDSFIRVEVYDDGRSIPEKYRSIVFEKFSQVEDYIHKNKSNEGTGLGLPISKKIIETLGGIIDYRNEDHGGITFFFEIPRNIK